MLFSQNIKNIPFISHGFFTRRGGVSTGIYTSLNCSYGSDDNPELVTENRRRVSTQLGGVPLCTLRQVHSSRAVEATAPWALGSAPEADGMATRTPGIALAILTADCAPIVFADTQARVIGAAHAGWKGALGGVLEATLALMETLGASKTRIQAAIGPCIRQESYEVGAEFREGFLKNSESYGRFFAPSTRNGHFRFDLPGFVRARLLSAGITAIEVIERDTLAEEDMFFSYRRTTLRGETNYGRQVSAIALLP